MSLPDAARMSELFSERRRRFMAKMEGGVALFPAARTTNRNADTEYPFRQESDFYYFTGFEEPQALLALVPGREEGEVVFFVRPRDPEKEVWTGGRAGVEGAKEDYGADEAFELSELEAKLSELLENQERIYARLGIDSLFDSLVLRALNAVRGKVRLGVLAPAAIVDPTFISWEMRLRKGPEEVALLREAARITAEAHRQAMAAVRPGMREYELQALVEACFRRLGSPRVAFETIVAAGANATVLHYVENRAVVPEGSLVLIDAGCEYGYYSGDVTRTFPAGAEFGEAQKEVYALVLRSQHAAIETARPGNTFMQVHEAARDVLTRGLIEMGAIEGPFEAAIEEERFKPYFMHRVGHWLGMDVHDVGPYKRAEGWVTLEPGMAFTIEPGLYFADAEEVPGRYRGIGVRIEDDILITTEGREVLTAGVPKQIEEVEALRREALDGSR